MKDNDKMIYAIAISSAVASGIMNYQTETKTPEPTPAVIKVEQPPPPPPPKPPEAKH
jgi:hypothetical protein